MGITQKAIAQRLSVSRTLVSAALNDMPGVAPATRERIRALAAELGYRPNPVALQLKGGRSGLIGLLIGAENPKVNFERMMHVERVAFECGYRSIIGQIHGENETISARAYLEDMRARGVDAIVWLYHSSRLETLRADNLGDMSGILFLDLQPTPSTFCIHVDRAAGIRDAVRHLTQNGRKRIGMALYAGGNDDQRGPIPSRIRGYRQGLLAAGIPFREHLIWAGKHASASAPSSQTISKALDNLVFAQRADAILANNDNWGVAIIKALRARGLRVPDDVAVVGFDNLDIGMAVDPTLTTIDQNHGDFARITMEMLTSMIAGDVQSKQRRVQAVTPELIVRDSA